jgi:hypothetical protein
MCNCSPVKACDCERERSEAVSVITGTVSDLFWKIRDIDGKDKQEEALLKLFAYLAKSTDIKKLAESILEVQKQAKLKEIKDEEMDDMEDKKEEVSMLSMFEEL